MNHQGTKNTKLKPARSMGVEARRQIGLWIVLWLVLASCAALLAVILSEILL